MWYFRKKGILGRNLILLIRYIYLNRQNEHIGDTGINTILYNVSHLVGYCNNKQFIILVFLKLLHLKGRATFVTFKRD